MAQHSSTFGPESAHRSTSSTKWFGLNASSAFGNVITVHISVSACRSASQCRFASGPVYAPVIMQSMRSTRYLVIPHRLGFEPESPAWLTATLPLRHSAKLASVFCCTLFKAANNGTVPIVLPAGGMTEVTTDRYGRWCRYFTLLCGR